MKKIVQLFFLLLSVTHVVVSQVHVNHKHINIDSIPEEYITAARENLHIYYGHESHGFQLTSGGMQALVNYSGDYATRFAFSDNDLAESLHIVEVNSSLSIPGWDDLTIAHLEANPETNVVIWAWCNLIDDVAGSVKDYCSRMENLISIYGPGGSAGRANPVTFVFMTGHGNSRFPEDYSRSDPTNEPTLMKNDSIRAYCLDNNKWLYDFNAFEMYDPNGNYYGDGVANGALYTYTGTRRLKEDCSYLLNPPEDNVRGNWNHEWMADNPSHLLSQLAASDNCTECAHTDGGDSYNQDARLHCVTKGIGAWYLWAKIAGWEGGDFNAIDEEQSEGQPNDLEVLYNNNHIQVLTKPQFNGQYQLSIIDMNGRICMQKTVNNDDWVSIQGLKPGVYIMRVPIHNSVLVKKIVVAQ